MEINLEKKVGFQKLPQEEIEFLQIQKREKSRIKIFVILTLCLTIIGKLTLHYQASTDEDVSVDRHDEGNDHSDQGQSLDRLLSHDMDILALNLCGGLIRRKVAF